MTACTDAAERMRRYRQRRRDGYRVCRVVVSAEVEAVLRAHGLLDDSDLDEVLSELVEDACISFARQNSVTRNGCSDS